MFRAFIVLLVVLLAGTPAWAERKPLRLIRDAEIEHMVRLYATPVFQVAVLDPATVNVYLVQDKRINAFVAGGMNLFINTGLILKAENAGELIGVIAHETGHIAGGHLARTAEALRNARGAALLASILGAAVVVAGGGDVGAGVALGGTGIAERNLLSFSRAQENAADQAALRYLDGAGLSSRGLVTFFDKLADQELLSATRRDPYLTTHPLTRDRIEHVRQHLTTSALADAPLPEGFALMFERAKAKLTGFVEQPATTFRRYPDSDGSPTARYARAIALHRKADLAGAIVLVDGLLAEEPDNAFFHELKGQILFESGDPAGAVPEYRAAVAAAPGELLLRVGLAQALLEAGDEGVAEAAEQLEQALERDREFPTTWRLLGQAYGRLGREPELALAAAEAAYLTGAYADARHFADRALKGLTPNTPPWYHAQDILVATETTP